MFKNRKKTCDIHEKHNKKHQNNIKNAENNFKFVLHPVTIIFALASIVVGMFWLFFMYLFCLLVHEFSHMIVAKKLGYKCSKITLYPTGALLSGSTDEFTFKDEIFIALAGPLSNLCMIVLCVFLWWIYPEIYNYTADFVVANLSLAVFNLLPIFPLDGGRVMLAILSLFLERKHASKITKNITLCVSLLLFVVFGISLFFVPNFQIGLSSVVIFISVLSEDKQASYKRIVKTDLKRRKLKHGLKVVSLMFDSQTKLSKVISKIDNYAYYNILVVDQSFKCIAKLTEEQVYQLSEKAVLSESILSALNKVTQ